MPSPCVRFLDAFFRCQPDPSTICSLSLHDALPIYLVVTAMTAVGIYLTITRKHARWLVVALLAAAVLTLLAAGPPENPLRALARSEEHTSELQSRFDLVCRLLLEKKNRAHHSEHGR